MKPKLLLCCRVVVAFQLEKLRTKFGSRLDGLTLIPDNVRLQYSAFLFSKHSPVKRSVY